MSRRASDRAATRAPAHARVGARGGRGALLAAALALAACGDGAPATRPARTLDLCANDSGLGAALAGGQLRVTVQRPDGTLVVAGNAAPDRTTQLGLDGASSGDLVVVEGQGADGAPVALGSATIGDAGACVCMARHVWRAFAEWTDDAGVVHIGPGAGFFVGTPPPGLVNSTPLALDRGHVDAGEVQVASFALQNDSMVTQRLRLLQLLARPPGATHASGLLDDFTPQPVSELGPGDEVHVQAMRTFSSSDPTGQWAAFVRWSDALGSTHDGPEVQFLVGPTSEPLLPSTALRLGHTWLPAPDQAAQHGDLMLQNPGAAAVSYHDAVVTARPPGGSDSGGPFLDFSFKQTGSLAPGATLDVAGDRPFTAAQNGCAGLVCVVQGGQCQLMPGP
jgi:hypothetical protein